MMRKLTFYDASENLKCAFSNPKRYKIHKPLHPEHPPTYTRMMMSYTIKVLVEMHEQGRLATDHIVIDDPSWFHVKDLSCSRNDEATPDHLGWIMGDTIEDVHKNAQIICATLARTSGIKVTSHNFARAQCILSACYTYGESGDGPYEDKSVFDIPWVAEHCGINMVAAAKVVEAYGNPTVPNFVAIAQALDDA